MNGKCIFFENKKISKSVFYKNKKLFIGYNDVDVIRPLCIKLPLMIGYVKNFDSNKTISFKVDDNKLLKKYNRIRKIISNLLNIEFDSEPVYGGNDKYIKTKIKMYEDRVHTNFQGKEVPKEYASYKCLSLIVLDSLIRVSKIYYPQTLLKECKYVIRKNKMENLINNDLDLSSSDYETDNKSDNESDSNEYNG